MTKTYKSLRTKGLDNNRCGETNVPYNETLGYERSRERKVLETNVTHRDLSFLTEGLGQDKSEYLLSYWFVQRMSKVSNK